MSKPGFAVADKANYGVEGIREVKMLWGLGTILLIATIFLFRIDGLVWTILSIILLIITLISYGEAVLMTLSSKKGQGRVVKDILEKLKLKKEDLVLDVGCGRGFLMNSMAKQVSGGKVIGIDNWSDKRHQNTLETTLQNADTEGVKDRIEVQTADARNLPFEDDTFDAVASSLTIHTLPDQDERQKALAEIVRVLKPGGRVAVLDFMYVEEYPAILEKVGLKNVEKSQFYFSMFPPVIIVSGMKKED
ncbi:class I SAM-dependent methyltransferase [Pseudalkalibacillus salsuginis]|uniref:class I SAM-dependent methyltransferase n=1 Tax=Pseudalkalibacillus salsuginis TaxID=2910972 RepID=UPI001F35085E|nr:class I SAM-dependent methyltransferase [Pseudalkalibacillus salsuginis]MCF6411401.1 class I SAM-dependent methyltransferase [Pseudalkalibacillus salsuginis]